MSVAGINGSALGSALQDMLVAPEIEPGAEPSYQLCKTIYMYHPLGSKMAEAPITKAQSQEREIAVPNAPEERVRDQFKAEWLAIGADERIANVMTLSRVYGIASIALVSEQVKADQPVDPKKLADMDIGFNVFDPLNTAGSLVLNQNPNAIDFQKVSSIAVSGLPYHRSRSVTIMNERPIYIGYTTSAFGFVGRSVYQRALYPLKSFVQTMVTDDMISRKAGVLIARMEQPGSIIDNIMQKLAGVKRALLKEAATNNVISVGKDELIESLNLQNIDGAGKFARGNILKNIATAADMPAVMLENETLTEGFGEGTEDAKEIARYIDGIRRKMQPLYGFFDRIVMARAWNKEFYATIQNDFPGYRTVKFERAFYDWSNSFTARWPSLLTEPESERIKVDDVKLKAIIAMLEVLIPNLDPENEATAIQWAQDNFNELKLLFQNPLLIDFEALKSYVPPEPAVMPEAPQPFADSVSRAKRAIGRYVDASNDLFGAAPAAPPKPDGRANGRHPS